MSMPFYTRKQFLDSYIIPIVSSPFMSTECPICQEQYSDSTGHCAVTFSDENTCNHVFCKICITSWLSDDHVNTCAVCRRVLFVLEDPQMDDYDEDEWDDEHEDIGFSPPEQIILNVLLSIWYKIWWQLSDYRHHVREFAAWRARAYQQPYPTHSRTEGIFDNEGKTHLPKVVSLVNSFQATVKSLALFHVAITLIAWLDDEEWELLVWLLEDMMELQEKHITATGGTEELPGFPLQRQEIWSGPLRRILVALTKF